MLYNLLYVVIHALFSLHDSLAYHIISLLYLAVLNDFLAIKNSKYFPYYTSFAEESEMNISEVVICKTEFILHSTNDSTMEILFKMCANKRLCPWNVALSGSLSRLKMSMQGCMSYFSMPAVKIQYGNSAW